MDTVTRMLRFVQKTGCTILVRVVGTPLEFDALSQDLEAAVNEGRIVTSCFPQCQDESRPLRTVEYMREWVDEEGRPEECDDDYAEVA